MFSWQHPPLARSHRSPDGGDFPRNIHRLAVATVRQTVGVFLATSTAWQRVATMGAVRPSHRSPVATVRQTVEIFLATSTAWQRMATMGAVRP
jgi:hypothetical protein